MDSIFRVRKLFAVLYAANSFTIRRAGVRQE
jgi:hypothetical protein